MCNLINTDVFETHVISYLVYDKCVADKTLPLEEMLSWSGKKILGNKCDRIKGIKGLLFFFASLVV